MKIWEASEYACIIEAGTFKPGNVHSRQEEFLDFMVSALLLGKSIRNVLNQNDIRLGKSIRDAVAERARVVPSNTNLGIILLHIPLAIAASVNHRNIGQALDTLVRTTTVEDAVEVAEALKISSAYLGTPPKGPDMRNEQVAVEIHRKGLTLADLFSLSSSWDRIALEWVTGFPLTFSGARRLVEGDSVLEVYMSILREYPDSLIQRKQGREIAERVSSDAATIHSAEDLKDWDAYLHREGINPGTTADLVASSIFLALLDDETLLKRLLDEARVSQH
ncbi:MAG: triphosphoribosyl-dephospho-CoA synthase [Theionarchaea archaeon]|nr:triphosphoribosyl-dephospho-CoA synthase [Theionarchaea archaeon]MBU6999930.1 triphosphoribosyl-dephospho-CoA synthase [Theionarchaea archaeon]MBU7020120.1 triphosphoribosyl-dephospho-CoA synthase [Theionarchaea archaeon]MBU7035582.1 triphosphoribosyl-dephospho-CoA synthase [Theionarchaea archaeon]MBU7039464.1 triphosphoribosyl-dephospho-CoA synthase [Theionarchaea archaeon]